MSDDAAISTDGDNTNQTTILKEFKRGNIEIKEISEGIFHATSTSSNYLIEYDKNKCIGAASCAAIAPLTFVMNDENKADMNEDTDDFDDDDTILAAAQSCPVFAIRILDKATKEVIFPVE